MAASVFSVSTSDSPFETLEADAVIETASAPRRLAAISKLVRVRVEASKNRLTIIWPRKLIGFSWNQSGAAENAGAVENAFDLDSIQRLDSQQSAGHLLSTSFPPATPSHAVDFLKLHFDDFVVGGLHHAADIARFDGQLAMAAIDQHQQLHARRPSLVEQRVERGADGAAGVEHVVHQDDVFAGDRERDFGGVDHRLFGNGGKIVAVQIDVENADRNHAILQVLDLFGETLRQRHAAAADADERQVVEILGFFQDLVRQPDQRPVDLGGAHELGFFACGNHLDVETGSDPLMVAASETPLA